MRLLVVGGLRDFDRSMRFLLSHWRWQRLNVEYIPFGWEKVDTRMAQRLDELKKRIDMLPPDEEINLMGISAGGTVVTLLLLERPKRIKTVITISSPINYFDPTVNAVLNDGLGLLKKLLPQAAPEVLTRVHSFRAKADAIVWPSSSALPGAKNYELPTKGHFVTIILALTFLSGRISACLK